MINITEEYPKESYVKNCEFVGDIDEVIFTVVDGVVIATLDGYKIEKIR